MERIEKLLSFPYSKRQFIYIVDDYNDIKSKSGDSVLNDAVDIIFDSIKETVKDANVPSRIIKNWKDKKWGKFIPYLNIAINTSEIINDKKKSSNLARYEVWAKEEIKPILFDSISQLNFQIGHPKKNIVYVAHPVDKHTYFTFADYHRLTFEHKCAEAIRLLLHLGATDIEAIHKTGWSKGFASRINVNVPLQDISSNFNGSVETSNNLSSDLLFRLKLDGSNRGPELPDDLVWYYHEESWKQIALGRLNFNLKHFSLEINYQDDNSVNTNFSIKVLDDYGLNLGGNFEKHTETKWVLNGIFK